MARVLITGGTGILGSALLPLLNAGGHTVRILSRSPRKPGYDTAAEWAQDHIAEGLADAVQDVDVIIHAASDALNAQEVDVQGTARLLEHAQTAGVAHLVYISIVGIDRIPMAYYKAKLEAERLIEGSSVPWSILRATQFHSLMERLFLLPVVKLPLIAPIPKRFKFQLIDVSDVAPALVDLVAQGPSGRVPDIGGPEVLTLENIARAWLDATGKRCLLVNLPLLGKTAAGFRRGYNTVPENRTGSITWRDWLARVYSQT